MKGQFCLLFFILSSQCIDLASISSLEFRPRRFKSWHVFFSFQETVWKAVLRLGCACRYPDNSANAHIETRASGTVCAPLEPEFIWSKPLLCGWWYRWLLVFSSVTAREKREECKSFHQMWTDQMGLFEACVFIVMWNEDSQIKNNPTSLSRVPGKWSNPHEEQLTKNSKTSHHKINIYLV